MPKIVLNDITSGYAAVDLLNENFERIETAFENTLSRDGTAPNTMIVDLDMNNQDILNVNNMDVGSLTVDGTDYITQAQAMITEVTDLYNATLALQNVTISTSSPTGGNDGDIWFTVSS